MISMINSRGLETRLPKSFLEKYSLIISTLQNFYTVCSSTWSIAKHTSYLAENNIKHQKGYLSLSFQFHNHLLLLACYINCVIHIRVFFCLRSLLQALNHQLEMGMICKRKLYCHGKLTSMPTHDNHLIVA